MAALFGGSELISMVGPLAVIMILLGTAVLLSWRFRRTGVIGRSGGSPAIKIVAARSLGWQSSLLIIEAQGQQFLAASGRAGVSVLSRLGASQAADFESVLVNQAGRTIDDQ